MGNGWAGIARLGGCGDNLVASSVLGHLAQRYQVEVITRMPQGVVFEGNPHVSKLTYLREADLPTDALAWQTYWANRAHEYDVFVNLSHSCETMTALFAGQSQFYWPEAFRRALCGRSYLELVHDICGVPHEFNPRFYPSDAEREHAAATKVKFGERVVGWCLSGTRLDKLYPASSLAIARIIAELRLPVVMFGGSNRETDIAATVLAHVERANGSRDGLHLCMSPDPQVWPLRRSLAQLQTCDVVIGPDTGLMWGVAMEPMGKVLMLSHASPENITKHWRNTVTLHADQTRVPCWPCHRLHENAATCTPNAANNGAACISDISVAALMAAVRSLLTEGETNAGNL